MDQGYKLSKDAEKDLYEVARYTLDKWGKAALQQYRDGLKETFDAIARNEVVARQFSKRFPQLRVTKYRYHYIFYTGEGSGMPIIIGVIHEKRDIVNRLKERF